MIVIVFVILICSNAFSNNRNHLYHIKNHKITKSTKLDALLGTVALVGAGPGDPELLTIQASKLIQNAQLVISDRLVSSEILQLVNCELRIARKAPGCANEAQNEIYDWVREGVLSGKNVVRLKIGDPFLFGRGGEEVIEFRKLGIEPVIAAGISSSYCAPLSSNIPLTHRGVANQVLITTGYGRDGMEVEIPSFSSDCTVVLLMAVGRLDDITKSMIHEKGYPVHTPIAIIENATTPKQRTIRGRLDDIARIAIEQNAKAPATIIIGEVVNVLEVNLNNYISYNLNNLSATSSQKITKESMSISNQ